MANQEWITGSWVEEPQNTCDTDDSENHRPYVMAISRAPIKCPIDGCDCMIGLSLILSHYLRDHTNGYEGKCKEVNLGMAQTLVFDPSQLEWGKNFCLGALVYGGQEEDKSTRPATRGLSVPNSMLPQYYEQFDTHLPVLIMACRTTWASLLPAESNQPSASMFPPPSFLPPPSVLPPPRPPPPLNVHPSLKVHPSACVVPSPRVVPTLRVHPSACALPSLSELTAQHVEDSNLFFDDEYKELIVIWLASLQTTKPIYCTVTVYDQDQNSCRGKMMPLRPLCDSQKPQDFALEDDDCLRLTHGDINILTQDRTNDIEMEIVFDELELK